MYDLMLYVLFA